MAVHDFKFEVVRLREKQDGGSAATACLDSGSKEDGRIRLGLVAGAAARRPVVLLSKPALSRLPARPPLAQASTPWGGDTPR